MENPDFVFFVPRWLKINHETRCVWDEIVYFDKEYADFFLIGRMRHVPFCAEITPEGQVSVRTWWAGVDDVRHPLETWEWFGFFQRHLSSPHSTLARMNIFVVFLQCLGVISENLETLLRHSYPNWPAVARENDLEYVLNLAARALAPFFAARDILLPQLLQFKSTVDKQEVFNVVQEAFARIVPYMVADRLGK